MLRWDSTRVLSSVPWGHASFNFLGGKQCLNKLNQMNIFPPSLGCEHCHALHQPPFFLGGLGRQ
eukprot:1029026-Amphidinium_carterae.1